MTDLAMAIGTLLLLAAAVAYWRFLKRRDADLEAFDQCAREFYKAADELLDDPSTPEDAVMLIGFLNQQIMRKAAAREFYHYVLAGQMGVARLTRKRNERSVRIQEALSDKPKIRELFERAIETGMLAMTFRSPRWGPRVRVWISAVDTAERQEDVAIRYQALAVKSDPSEPQLEAALC